MDKELGKKLATLSMSWMSKKDELNKESKKLKKFLKSLVGKNLYFKNRQYKITKILWDSANNFLGGSIEVTLQNCNPLIKFLCTTVKYIHFYEFYMGIEDGTFEIK